MIGRGKKHQRYKKKEERNESYQFFQIEESKRTRYFRSLGVMAFLLKESPECVKSELNLFLAPPTQTVIEKGQWVQFHPITNVADGGPIEFLIPGSGDAYPRSLSDPITLDVCLNERTVSSSNNTYPYRAIIETLLNHGYDSKTSQLTSELYYKDTAGRMNVYDENDKEPNEGFKSRVKFIKGSGTVDMVGRLHVDLFNQDRLFIKFSGCETKTHPKKVQVNPAVVIGHAKALERTTAKYPIDRVSCKVFSIPQSSYSFIQDNVFSGQMPKRIVIACVDNDAFNGNYKKSPFEFKHYDVNFIGVYVDGQPVPHQPLELDFEKGNYIQAYNNLFLNSEGLHLSRSEFSKGGQLRLLMFCQRDVSFENVDGTFAQSLYEEFVQFRKRAALLLLRASCFK
ncbi:uncharacterized protein F54H12.2 [Trichonephila clavipes]|nr:uncharacterized protein F54H12.2 [Trichonephila clavipes]